VVAAFVQGLSGFGFAMTSMAIWAWTLEPALAVVLGVFGSLVGQLIAAATVRRGFDARRLAPYLAGAALGLPAGLWLLPRLDVPTFQALLGTMLVVVCPLLFFAAHLPRVRRGGGVGALLSGSLGGAMGALGGFSGVAPALWCTLQDLPKDAQRSIVQNFNLAVLLAAFAGYLAAGHVKSAMLPHLGLAGAATLVPVLVGTSVYRRLSEAAFRRVVLGLLTLAGVALLATALPQLVAR